MAEQPIPGMSAADYEFCQGYFDGRDPNAPKPTGPLTPIGDDGWEGIAELKPKFGEVLGWADRCGYEVVRCHSDGHRYAGSFTADWVTHWRPLPIPPVGVSDNG